MPNNCEQGALGFHYALDPANYRAGHDLSCTLQSPVKALTCVGPIQEVPLAFTGQVGSVWTQRSRKEYSYYIHWIIKEPGGCTSSPNTPSEKAQGQLLFSWNDLPL